LLPEQVTDITALSTSEARSQNQKRSSGRVNIVNRQSMCKAYTNTAKGKAQI